MFNIAAPQPNISLLQSLKNPSDWRFLTKWNSSIDGARGSKSWNVRSGAGGGTKWRRTDSQAGRRAGITKWSIHPPQLRILLKASLPGSSRQILFFFLSQHPVRDQMFYLRRPIPSLPNLLYTSGSRNAELAMRFQIQASYDYEPESIIYLWHGWV